MTTKHTSRAQWDQIESRVKQADFFFDPKWKCLIDGQNWRRSRCGHNVADQHDIIEQVKDRLDME